jgi:hypothetical protein
MGGAPGVRLDGGTIFYTGQRETVYAGYSGVDRSFYNGPNAGFTFTGRGNFGGRGGGTTGPQNPERPKKEPNFVVVAKKDEYGACVFREWMTFNENVEKIKQAAEDNFGWKSLWIAVGSALPTGLPSVPGQQTLEPMPTEGPDYVVGLQKKKEIEEKTKQAESNRDEAIKNNCKKPT